ncbi:RcnB family protein [Massilia sp. AB1]|uniref:RcnB family protein n=1 Tax=Massilia sp. AB1 TaxID=2823371 RepID=UPI001B8248A0|nr:RcnB family protein [Massilia sp. AB1]MBQ5942460.1 RcnB family protein [Massilia sp. AB1]
MNELIVPVLLAALLSSGPGAHAQQRAQGGQHAALHDASVQQAGKARQTVRFRSVESFGELKRGEQLPPRYRTHHYVIENWRAHKLSEPPRGHQWVQAGASYVLVGIATGVVTEVVVAR